MIPNTAEINLKVNGEDKKDELPFKDFIESAIYDPKLSKTAKDIKTVRKLEKLFDEASPGDVVPVEDADWEKLKAVVEAPSGGYNSRVITQCDGFLEAILDAPTEEPEKEENA